MGALPGRMLDIEGGSPFCHCAARASGEEPEVKQKIHGEHWETCQYAYGPCYHEFCSNLHVQAKRQGDRTVTGVSAAEPGLRQWPAPGAPSLTMIVECHQPLLYEIAGFLAGSPREFVSFGSLTAHLVMTQMEVIANSMWSCMYARKWAAFHECMSYQGAKDWRGLFRDTLAGRCECTLEVFDREKKLGFAMAAMAARVQYEGSLNCYVARYLSASEVMPENIPLKDSHRLRFCPPSCRDKLQPGLKWPCDESDAKLEPASPERANHNAAYPYRVLQGLDGLEVGKGVELQWKMQYGSPFGWWFGTLETLRRDPEAQTATATIAFKHFPTTSRWYRLEVKFGDHEMRPCTFGGYTGGIRAASDSEVRHWMLFFPKEPVVF